MPEEKNVPQEPGPDDGANDILDKDGVSSHEGSEGTDEFAALAEKFGVDLTNIPEDARGEVELALRTAENAVHTLREEDSLEMDGLKDKAALYDRLSTQVQNQGVAVQTPLPGGALPTQEALFVGSELAAAVDSEDPEALARVLTKGVETAITRSNDKLGFERLVPIEKTITTMVEMAVLDGKYEGWRKDLPKVRQVLQVHPEYSLQQAYEGGVLVPRYNRDKQRDKAGWDKAREERRAAVKNSPVSTSTGPTDTTPAVYDTDKDAILAAIEAVEGKKK